MSTPTTSPTRPADPAGVIDLARDQRPPHPDGRPCGGGCVPACATRPAEPARQPGPPAR